MNKSFDICLLLLFFLPVTAGSTVIMVPAEQPTIQAGVDSASDTDTILVSPGFYTGPGNRDILFHGKNLRVIGEKGRDSTILDCRGSESEPHRAFSVLQRHGGPVGISGFTIQNGWSDTGGAVFISQLGVEIEDCKFVGNEAVMGGAIGASGYSPKISRSVFLSNRATFGGAIMVHDGAVITDCEFITNSAKYGGAAHLTGFVYSFDGRFENCSFISNDAIRGAALNLSGLKAVNCLFAKNTGRSTVEGGSADYDHCTFYGNNTVFGLDGPMSLAPRISNSVFAYNRGDIAECGQQPRTSPIPGDPELSFCNVFGNGSDYMGCIAEDFNTRGNISGEPLFCDTAALDFRLAGGSACIGAGENGSNIGAFGVGCIQTDVDDEEELALPDGFALEQNYPNPFNPSTKISYTIPYRSHVQIEIFDVLGQRVLELVGRDQSAGQYTVTWDASQYASGLYYYRIKTDGFVESRKMLLIK